MKFTRINNYDSTCNRSTPLKTYCNETDTLILTEGVKKHAKIVNFLTRLLLCGTKDNFMLDGKMYNPTEEFEKLIQLYNVLPEDKEQVFICLNYLVFDIMKKNEPRTYCAFLFGNPRLEKSFELNEIQHSLEILRKYFFPLNKFSINNEEIKLDDISSMEFYSITYNVFNGLNSYYKILEEYNKDKASYQEKKEKICKKIPTFNQYESLIEYALSNKLIKKSKYYKFINKWKSYTNKKGEFVIGMRDAFILLYNQFGKNYVFEQKDQSKYYYDISFVSTIYHEYTDIWLKEDIIGNDECVELFETGYHWKKETINISALDSVSIVLGDNYIKHKLNLVDSLKGKFSLSFLIGKNNITVNLPSNNYFGNLEIHLTDKKNSCNRKIVYYSDSKRKVGYSAFIKEPKIRYDFETKQLYLDSCLSDIHCLTQNTDFVFEIKNPLIKSTEELICDYFEPTLKNYDNRKNVKYDMNVMGIDVGLRDIVSCTIANTKKEFDETKPRINMITNFTNMKNEHLDTKVLTETDSLISFTACLCKRIVRHYKDNKNFETVDNKVFTEWFKENQIPSSFDIDTFIKELKELPAQPENNKYYIAYWRYIGNSQKTYFTYFKQWLKKVHLQYNDCKNMTNNLPPEIANIVDRNFFAKALITKKYIALQCSIGNSLVNNQNKKYLFNGNFNSEADYCNNDNLKNEHKYFEGLKKHMRNSISAFVVSMAVKNKVKVIFIENLKFTRRDESVDNELIDVWSSSDFLKTLENKARKHGIVTIRANPDFTSQIDSTTGIKGEREGKTITVKNNIKKDADLNASENIIIKGINHNLSIQKLNVDKLNNGMYCIHKNKAILSIFGKDSIMFEPTFTNKKLNIIKNDFITPYDSSEQTPVKKIGKKKSYIILTNYDEPLITEVIL